MKDGTPQSHAGHDLDPATVEAFEKALKMPHGRERTDAIQKAGALQHASAAYGWLFSNELKPPG